MQENFNRYSYLFFGVLIIVLAGFYKSYISHIPNLDIYPTVVHFHAAVLFIWFLLLIVQPYLIRKGKVNLHRSIGKSTYVLIPAIIVSIVFMSKMGFERSLAREGVTDFNLRASLLFDYLSIAFFIMFYLIAVRNTKKPIRHVKYILACTLILFIPAIGRFTGQQLGNSPFTFYIIYFHAYLIIAVLWIAESIKTKKFSLKNDFLMITILFATYHLIYFHAEGTLIWQSMAEIIIYLWY